MYLFIYLWYSIDGLKCWIRVCITPIKVYNKRVFDSLSVVSLGSVVVCMHNVKETVCTLSAYYF